MKAKLSVVIPVHNEAKTITEIIKRVKSIDIDKEIIIVDDGSTDGTRQILKKINDSNIKILYHNKNLGKGAALRTGFQYISGDIVITQDADLEYDPKDYQSLIEPIVEHNADVVFGSRLSGGKPQRAYMFWHKLANNIFALLTNILYNTTLTNIETGYKVFRTEVIKGIKLRSNGFAIEPEITAKILKKGCYIYEVPIAYYGRTY